jgi:hypothetical protein
MFNPYVCAERGRAPAAVPGAVDGRVHHQRVRGGVGAGGRLRLRRLGQHDQLRPPDRHVRPLHQVLPVPAAAAAPTGRLPPVPHRRPQQHHHAVQRDRWTRTGTCSFTGASPPPPPPAAASQPWALKSEDTSLATGTAVHDPTLVSVNPSLVSLA